MAKTNTADIGFEKEIWKAADLLRGNLDASEYKSVVRQNTMHWLLRVTASKRTKTNIHRKTSSLFPKKRVGLLWQKLLIHQK